MSREIKKRFLGTIRVVERVAGGVYDKWQKKSHKSFDWLISHRRI